MNFLIIPNQNLSEKKNDYSSLYDLGHEDFEC